MKERSICRRCHRLRAVNEVRYCEGCAEELRAMERPRRRPQAAPSAVGGSEIQAEAPVFVAPDLEP